MNGGDGRTAGPCDIARNLVCIYERSSGNAKQLTDGTFTAANSACQTYSCRAHFGPADDRQPGFKGRRA